LVFLGVLRLFAHLRMQGNSWGSGLDRHDAREACWSTIRPVVSASAVADAHAETSSSITCAAARRPTSATGNVQPFIAGAVLPIEAAQQTSGITHQGELRGQSRKGVGMSIPAVEQAVEPDGACAPQVNGIAFDGRGTRCDLTAPSVVDHPGILRRTRTCNTCVLHVRNKRWQDSTHAGVFLATPPCCGRVRMAVLGASAVGRDRRCFVAGFADTSVSAGVKWDFGRLQASHSCASSVFVNRNGQTCARCQRSNDWQARSSARRADIWPGQQHQVRDAHNLESCRCRW